MAAAEEVADHDAVAVGRARGGAGSAWAAGSAVRAEVGSGDRPGGDAGGGERPQGDLALGSPAAAGRGLSGILCAGPVDHHARTNLSSNMMANWVFASPHSRGDIFHSAAV